MWLLCRGTRSAGLIRSGPYRKPTARNVRIAIDPHISITVSGRTPGMKGYGYIPKGSAQLDVIEIFMDGKIRTLI